MVHVRAQNKDLFFVVYTINIIHTFTQPLCCVFTRSPSTGELFVTRTETTLETHYHFFFHMRKRWVNEFRFCIYTLRGFVIFYVHKIFDIQKLNIISRVQKGKTIFIYKHMCVLLPIHKYLIISSLKVGHICIETYNRIDVLYYVHLTRIMYTSNRTKNILLYR